MRICWCVLAFSYFVLALASKQKCSDCLCKSREVDCGNLQKAPNQLTFPKDKLDYRFEHNGLVSLDVHSFYLLTNMQWIYLTNNSLTKIPGKTFYKNADLHAVYLNNNNLTNLPSNLFSKTPNLQEFYCSDNQITHIDQYVFANLPKLTQLRLANNRLVAVHPMAFSTANALSTLYLEENLLETAYWTWIANMSLSATSEIELDANRWSCDCRMWPFVHSVTSHKQRLSVVRNSHLSLPMCPGPDGRKTALTDKTKHDLVCRKAFFNFPLNSSAVSINVDAVEGGNVNLTCSGHGMPIPHLTLFNEVQQTLITGIGHVCFEIKEVTRDQLGKYKCMMVGTDNKGHDLVVNKTINLRIDSSSKRPVSVGTILAILLSVIFVIGVASCFWRRQKSRDGYGSLENTGGGAAYYELDESKVPEYQTQATPLEEENLFSDEEVYSKGDDKEVLV
uniref:Leucine-rich repeat and fibronectin type-III domain-containing protein 3 n=1 Tax=Phallusia mammillata TaxID=59560 RepID=A0A6F9DKP8_9ASCI|nr:leucine-rich repeat and fibronectin type-III domain-containing protein 3 [Phallusia mammillata]